MLTDKQRKKIIDKLPSEPSDSKIADKFGVSRKTVWRLRQEELERQAKLKRAKTRMKSKEINKMGSKPTPTAAPAEPVQTLPPPPPAAPAPAIVDPTPKVDAEPVVMATYFAAQRLRGESVKDVAAAIMQRAEAQGRLFRKLQVLDCISVGTSSFVRFRSDLTDIPAVLGSSNRGFISFLDGTYRITFSDGRQGIKYPTSVMCSTQKVGFGQTFAGPKIKRWAQQFASAN